MKCCDMHAGKLSTPVEFETKTRVSNGTGGFTETWAAISGAPDRAYMKALSGSERFASDRVEAMTRWRATVRYSAVIGDEDRALIGGRYYNIKFQNNIEMRNMWLEIDLDGGAAT